VIYVCDNHSEKECIEIVDEYVKAFSKSVVDIYNIEGISIIDSASISTRLIEK
jgi:capsular polysaccharide biosynthesis protein